MKDAEPLGMLESKSVAPWRRVVSSATALAICLLALYALHHELRAYHLHDIRSALQAIPSGNLKLAGLFTLFSYLAMTGYDVLALRYVGHPLSVRRTVLASFMSYAFSNNLGFFMLTGGAVRYRLYSAWGVQTLGIARIILFCSFTFILGLLSFGSLIFLLFPLDIPAEIHLPFATTQPLGVIFGCAVLAYAGLSLFRRKPLRVWAFEFPVPPLWFSFAQALIASLDWAFAGLTLYVLLPHDTGLGLSNFFTVFILAQIAAITSQVPGGLGVFETIMVLLLSPVTKAPDVVAALLVFRAIYYLAPFGVATSLLGAREFFRNRQTLLDAAYAAGHWTLCAIPSVMALLTFIAGATMLFSGATPDLIWHTRHIAIRLPVPLVEISHFASSVVGVWLLMLARGIRRRLDAAYLATVILLAAGALFSILKGFVFQESIALLAIMAVLAACRRDFTRKASLLSGTFTAGWIVSVGAVLISTVWLTFFAYKRVEYSSDFWWRFALDEQAPRSLRALVGAACALLTVALGRLFRPAQPRHEPATPEITKKAETIIGRSRDTSDNLALLGDKSFLFSDSGNAFIMYGVQNRSWIAMGDPVGPFEEWPELLWRFREECHAHMGRPVFYEIGCDHLNVYLDLGLNLLKLGEDARVALPSFSPESIAHGSLQRVMRHMARDGFTFEIVPQSQTETLMPELRRVSDAWLAEKHTREKRFSLGRFDETYVRRFPVAIVRGHGRIEAFATVWESAGREELSVDLMRHLPDSPNGMMDFLFVCLMLRGREEGYQWFNLGMAPLSGLPQHELAPLWNRVGGFLFRHSEHFYNFQGVRRYKAKFNPQRTPRYLASQGGLTLPTVLGDLSSLISGGIRGLIAK